MKRSEMETILQEFIDHQEHYGYSINAGTILEIVEKAGMFYCPIEDLGDFGRLRVVKGWEEE